MKDAYYFSHDSGAHKDPKIIQLRTIQGWAGYGIFWAIIETLRDQSKWRWEAKLKQGLTIAIGGDEKQILSVIETLLELKLLEEEKDYIHAPSLTRRMKEFEKKRTRYAENGRKGGIKSGQARLQPLLKQGFKQKESDAQALKESKVKKSSKEEPTFSFLDSFLKGFPEVKPEYQLRGKGEVEINTTKAMILKLCELNGGGPEEARWYYNKLDDVGFYNRSNFPMKVSEMVEDLTDLFKRKWVKKMTEREFKEING
jgi:hypothetical protein